MSYTTVRVLLVIGVFGLGLVAMFDDVFDLEERLETNLAAPAKKAVEKKGLASGRLF